jgi:UDP-N-acetylglucosamine 2-epimerase (non-hydrolysing)
MAPVFFVAHPRTRDRLRNVHRLEGLIELTDPNTDIQSGFIYILPPLAYLEFLRMMSKCQAVLTDSGGIQEETTFLGIPCLTMRENTERPITITLGTNQLVGLDREKIVASLERVMVGHKSTGLRPPLWDGRAAERVVDSLKKSLG